MGDPPGRPTAESYGSGGRPGGCRDARWFGDASGVALASSFRRPWRSRALHPRHVHRRFAAGESPGAVRFKYDGLGGNLPWDVAWSCDSRSMRGRKQFGQRVPAATYPGGLGRLFENVPASRRADEALPVPDDGFTAAVTEETRPGGKIRGRPRTGPRESAGRPGGAADPTLRPRPS